MIDVLALLLGALAAALRTRRDLVAENLLLRHQLAVLARPTRRRPRPARRDKLLWVLACQLVPGWRRHLVLVTPDTVVRWHRLGWRLVWRWRSRSVGGRPRLSGEARDLIRSMSRDNRLWGTERVRGEMRKLGIPVGKRTVQRYMRGTRPPRPAGQTWSTFLRTHGRAIWACDFLQLTDLFFRPVFAFVVVELGSRRVVHVGVTRSPTDAWVAQQLREATPDGARPRFLVRDHDATYGPAFARVAAVSGIEVIRTPVRAPRANAVCEWFLGRVRRECIDHTLILGERHLRRVLAEYVRHFNRGRPHQGIGQRTPMPVESAVAPLRRHTHGKERVIAVPVLGGLHHEYRLAA